MIKVTHIITGLDVGGAETMLYKLVSNTDRSCFESQVISLSGIGPIGERIRDSEIRVRAIGMRPNVPDPRKILRLARWLRADRPDIVQTWMYHADLLGGLAARLAGNTTVAWNIRHSHLHVATVKRTTIMIGALCARMSTWLPTRIVCCSEAGAQVHCKMGYAPDKIVVIPNGFDLDRFRPNPTARDSVRAELGVDTDTLIVGLVCRFDPQKDHANFVSAARLLNEKIKGVHFVLCGEGVVWENRRLAAAIDAACMRANFHLLGRRADIARLTAAFDIAASASSYGEGFPNVLGEAMACAVPCVATDVGDSSAIIGDCGVTVPPKDPQAFADALVELLTKDKREHLGEAARCRVQKHFSLGSVTSRYEKLYQELATECVGLPVSLR